MAAADTQARSDRSPRLSPAAVKRRCLDAFELHERIDEEIGRASRHGTALCCLLVRMDDFEDLASAHGRALSESALLHAAEALLAELRRFDRIGRPADEELLVVLPGAAVRQGEAVARRALERLHSIKIEVGRSRRPLSISVGIVEWTHPWSSRRLVEEARAAAGISNGALIEQLAPVDAAEPRAVES